MIERAYPKKPKSFNTEDTKDTEDFTRACLVALVTLVGTLAASRRQLRKPRGKMEQHRWKFMRAGGVDQVVIRSGADIVNLGALDQKLWVALACPTRGVDLDPRTLDLIDADGDGRIRPPELIAASKWVQAYFRNPDVLLEGGDTIELAAINDATPEGVALAAEARHSLELLGRTSADAISLHDVLERKRSFAARPYNGDGVVRADSTEDENLGRIIREIIDTQGSVPDRDGQPGIDRAKLTAFFDEAAALDAWQARGECSADTLPLGAATLAAAEAVAAVKDKVEDYYARTRLAEYDESAAFALSPARRDYRAMAGQTLALDSASIAELPLAEIAPGKPLALRDALNPAWAARIETFRQRVVVPLMGEDKTTLAESEWRDLRGRLEPCATWIASRPETRLAKLDIARVREILASGAQAALEALIGRDEAATEESAQLDNLERLVRYKRDLVRLLNNFVSFSDFYSRRGAIFEAGTLYLDARSCDLTVQVSDSAKHAVLAGLAKAYLAYCECTRGKEKMTIVAAFTAGDVDYLLVGRNGVFYDRQGRDWDATITKVIENPISIRQGFFSPYKKFIRMIEEQAAKRAAANDAKAQGKLGGIATQIVKVDTPPATAGGPPKSALQRRIDVGTVAALGVALGSISAVLVGVFSKFVDLGWWIPAALAGIVLAISGPSMVIAWLKLRQRSLGPILDASGWAINGRMRINVPLGASLSRTARIPRGAERELADPFRESHTGRYWMLLGVVVIAAAYAVWRYRLFPGVLP